MAEKAINTKKPLYMAFEDSEKAFDYVEWKKMFGLLEKLETDHNDRRKNCQLHEKQVVTMRTRNGRHRG
jgi:hypothetical protein